MSWHLVSLRARHGTTTAALKPTDYLVGAAVTRCSPTVTPRPTQPSRSPKALMAHRTLPCLGADPPDVMAS
eukprot:666970-Prymnesium_polylepis.1